MDAPFDVWAAPAWNADPAMCSGAEKSAPEVSFDEPPQAVSESAASVSSTVHAMRAKGRALCAKETLIGSSIYVELLKTCRIWAVCGKRDI